MSRNVIQLALAVGLLPGMPCLAQEPNPPVELARGTTQDTQTEPLARTTVGMRGVVNGIFLPGPRRFAMPVLDPGKAPLLLEILESRHMSPAESGAESWSYDFAYTAFVPGRHNLSDYLVDAEEQPVSGLRAIPVDVTAILPPGPAKPLELTPDTTPWGGGYGAALWVGGVLWVIGLLVGIFAFRKKPAAATADSGPSGPTLADRLQPLVEGAMAGTLDDHRKAELERLLLDHWRQQLGLESAEPVAALRAMHQHGQAGELLKALEHWLHRPPAKDGSNPVDAQRVQELLAPYRTVAAPEAPGDANP